MIMIKQELRMMLGRMQKEVNKQIDQIEHAKKQGTYKTAAQRASEEQDKDAKQKLANKPPEVPQRT